MSVVFNYYGEIKTCRRKCKGYYLIYKPYKRANFRSPLRPGQIAKSLSFITQNARLPFKVIIIIIVIEACDITAL